MKTVALVLAMLAVGCVTGEDHPTPPDQRGESPSDVVSADAGTVDAGPPCPTNTVQVALCNQDPYWSLCATTLYPSPPACDALDKTTKAWLDCVSPPASGCTLDVGLGRPSECVASCQ